MSRRTMLAPILPNPIIASCMTFPPLEPSCGPQPFHGGGDAFAVVENCLDGDHDFGVCVNRQRSRCHVDPTVPREIAPPLKTRRQSRIRASPRYWRVEEMLMPEPRV